MRIAFLGTPAFAVPTLIALHDAGHDIAAVYTRPPKPAGRRGLDLTPSPVHAAATAKGLPVLTPASLRDDIAADRFVVLGAAVGIVVGYGMILPSRVLATPTHGCLNLHPSLLPRWRGAAPIQRPILAGDTETGVAIMKMDEGLDTGPIALEERVPLPPDATSGDMHDHLAAIGARLMVDAVRRLADGTLHLRPQADEGIVYALKIDKTEARIDWTQPAVQIHNLVRGLSPAPGAFFEADLGKGPERIKILRAAPTAGHGPPGSLLDGGTAMACGDGAIRLIEVQRAGSKPMSGEAFARGIRLPAKQGL